MNRYGHRPRRSIEYLRQGSEAQRRAYQVLTELKILERLKEYDAVLAGTFPLDLVVPGSDLDVICEVHSGEAFVADVERCFELGSGFQVKTSSALKKDAIIVNFIADGIPIQLYAEATPVAAQAACLHLQVERRLLELSGPWAREQVLRLKKAGLKTEPAFAAWLGLSGDSYQALLALAQLNDNELRDWYYHQRRETSRREADKNLSRPR